MKQDPFLRTLSERALRERAHRLGYHLSKGRPRFVGSTPGYMLIDQSHGCVVFSGNSSFDFSASLEDCQRWLGTEAQRQEKATKR